MKVSSCRHCPLMDHDRHRCGVVLLTHTSATTRAVREAYRVAGHPPACCPLRVGSTTIIVELSERVR